MRKRMALGSAVCAVWLSTATALGQAGQQLPAATTAKPVSPAPTTTTTAKVPAAATGGISLGGSAGTTGAGASVGTSVATAPVAGGTSVEGATTNTAEKADVDAATYAVRLRDLEQRINELKEQIFRSKARLSLLAETVLQGVVAGSQTAIVHENKMSASYKLVKVVYTLDGAPIFNRTDEEGGLGDQPEFEVYNGSIVPGEHTLTANLEYRGHGYGIFSYLKGYRFKVRSSYSFTAPEGKAVEVRVVGYEKGGPTAPLEERPAVRYQERVLESTGSTAPEPQAQAPVGAEGGK
ncbi:MAG: hypothetical protein RL385_203 [Pseudomonadota bacterium]